LARDFSVFLSSNNSIWEYDLRRAASPVVVLSQDDESCPPFLTADDEVNQIALNQQKGIAAAVDDAGSLSVWSLETPQHNHQKQIQSASVPDTIMTTVSLRPHTPKAAQAVSGSTDGCIRLWDVGFGRGRKLRLLDAVDMNAVSNNDVYSSSSNQICNPPMVHHVAFSPSGRLLAAALGDGSISLTKVDTRSFGNTTRLSDAHGGPVASVVFGSWNDERSSSRVDAADRLLCSAGNDGAIVYWDLGTNLCGRKTLLPVEDFFLRVQLRSHPPPSTYHNDAADSAVAEGEPRSLFAVQHGAKPNWMVSSRSSDPLFPSTLFVADTSNQVTAYTIPLSS
jgi:WD40 repeat protein